jgi:hypothetical protein
MIRLKPAVFGYHEVFHLLVMDGVAAHFLAISLFAGPLAERIPLVDRAAAADRLRLLVGAAPFGFGVDDPAARSGRLQTLGLRSTSLAVPLVPSRRALVQLRVPAVHRNLKVGGLAPLRLGLGEPVRGQRRPIKHRTGHLDHRAPRRPGRRTQPLQRRRGIQVFPVDEDIYGLLHQRLVLQGRLQLVGQPAGDPRPHRGRKQARDQPGIGLQRSRLTVVPLPWGGDVDIQCAHRATTELDGRAQVAGDGCDHPVGGAGSMQRAGVVDKHEPGQIGIEQGLGRAQHLLQRPGEAPLNVEGIQGAKASRQVRWVDRHGLEPFWRSPTGGPVRRARD